MRRVDDDREYNYGSYNGRTKKVVKRKKSSSKIKRPKPERHSYDDYNNNYYPYDEYEDYGVNDYGYNDYEYDDNYPEDDYVEYYDEGQPKRRGKKPKKEHKILRFIAVILLICICSWLLYTAFSSFVNGNKFSVFGPGTQNVRDIVVAGVDEGGYRTDLILLCRIDRTKNEMNILQIPRDTRIENNHRNDRKINSAFFSGFECMSREISQVTGITPEGYIMVSFDGFNEIIDALGGVTVDVPVRMNYTDPTQNLVIDLQPGKQKLDGAHAQMFMRFRKNDDGTGYANGDMDRINTQKLLYSAVIDKVKSPLIAFRAPFLLSAMKKHTTTNLDGDFVGVLSDMAACAGNVNFYSLPGGGKYIGGVSYFVHNKTETQKLINEHFISNAE